MTTGINMIIKYLSLVLILTIFLFAEQNPVKIRSKYTDLKKYLKLVDEWQFQLMEIITQAEEEKREIIEADENNVETLSFHRSGSMSYISIEDEIKKIGRGRWFVSKENHIWILADLDTIEASYHIKDNILTIITSEEESEDFYAYKTIVKYRPK